MYVDLHQNLQAKRNYEEDLQQETLHPMVRTLLEHYIEQIDKRIEEIRRDARPSRYATCA